VPGQEAWNMFYDGEYLVALEKEKLIQAIIPLQLVPYSNVAWQSYPCIDDGKQAIVDLALNPEFTTSTLKEHTM